MNELIDLDTASMLPFATMSVNRHIKMGKMAVKQNSDVLYIGKYKVILRYYTRNASFEAYPRNHMFCEKLESHPVLNATFGDFLLAYPRYLPNEWKRDSAGALIAGTIFTIFFRGTFFQHPRGSLYIMGISLNQTGLWYPRYVWLGEEYQFNCAHAVLDS